MTNDEQSLVAYDVSTPEAPREAGRLLLPHLLENEDVATNGRILLLAQLGDVQYFGVSQEGTVVNVVDVRDPAHMEVIATVDGGGDHTWECLLDCTWAYSANGLILDLRDPRKPVLLEKRWTETAVGDTEVPVAHDVTEVAPGRVLTASEPMVRLDAGTNPATPRVLAVGPFES